MAPPGIGSSRGNSSAADSSSTNSKNDTAENIVILDGGFATQLSCHISNKIDGDVLWSARFLHTHPEAVINAHRDFLRAGAELIMTNTYQANVDLFVKHLQLTEEESYNLIKKAVEYAKTAVERHLEEFPDSTKPLIAGSVGPYAVCLHDGSEYTGSYTKITPVETLKQWHIPRIKALVEAGVDILALETIPSALEAEMLVKLLKEQFPTTKAWLSFSVNQEGNRTTAFGDDFQETAKRCYDMNPEQLVAVGVNCAAPRLIESFLTDINKFRTKKIPLIVYPNSGECYTINYGWINRQKCEPIGPYVKKWLELGVTWVGGCCRTYAVDVTLIRDEVERWRIAQREKVNCETKCNVPVAQNNVI